MKYPLPPLHAIRTFEAAGRLQSFSLAAQQLHVTPAAVSRQIRRLEEFLGVQLFVREHRAVRLSGAGQAYLRAVSTHLEGLRRASQQVSTLRPGVDLRLCVPPTFAARWLIPRLAKFHHEHPGIGVQIKTDVNWVDLDSQGLDAAIRFGDGQWAGLNALALAPNIITPVCAPHLVPNYKAAKRSLAPGSFAGATLLYSLTRPDDWYEWLQAAGLKPMRIHRLEYESSMLAFQAAISGLGFGIAQIALVADELRNGQLIAPFGLQVNLRPNTYYLVWRRSARSDGALAQFLEWIAAVAQCHET